MEDLNEVVEGNQVETPESEDTTQVDSTEKPLEETLPEVDETAQTTDVDEAEAEAEGQRREEQSSKDKAWQEAIEAKEQARIYKEQLDEVKSRPAPQPDSDLSPKQARIKELNTAMLKNDELAAVAANLKVKIDAGEMTNAEGVAEWARDRRIFEATQTAQAAQNASHSSVASAEMGKIMSGVPDNERGDVQAALKRLGLDINDPPSYANADPKFLEELVGHVTNSVRSSSGGLSDKPPPTPPKVMTASGATAVPQTPSDTTGSFTELAEQLKEAAGLT